LLVQSIYGSSRLDRLKFRFEILKFGESARGGSAEAGHPAVDHVARSDRLSSSVAVDRSNAVLPVRGCLKRGLVQRVTVRLIRLPASLLGREFA